MRLHLNRYSENLQWRGSGQVEDRFIDGICLRELNVHKECQVQWRGSGLVEDRFIDGICLRELNVHKECQDMESNTLYKP